MSEKAKIRRKDGFLTRYGFACGYVQEKWHHSRQCLARMYQDGGAHGVIVVELVQDQPYRVILTAELFEPWDTDLGRSGAFREAEKYYRAYCAELGRSGQG